MSAPELPKKLGHELDTLFLALKAVPGLLQAGRAYGLAVGVSPDLAAQLVRRHGEAATEVVNNLWTVDPKTPATRRAA